MPRRKKGPPPPPPKLGRPFKEINEKFLEQMCMRHSTMDEMADALSIGVEALRRNYGDQIKIWRALGKDDLRNEQWKILRKGSSDMGKWLGRDILKQNEALDLSEQNKSLLGDYIEAIVQARSALRGTDSKEDLSTPSSGIQTQTWPDSQQTVHRN